MAKTKKQQEDYAAELQKSFERWEHINVNGGNDPTWSDGCNMNLVHNHILNYKRKIEESCAARVRNLKPPENEQMNFFVDYSDCEDEEDEWDCEL